MSTRMYRSTTPGNYAPVKLIAPVTSVAAYQECGLSGKAGGDATGLTVDFAGYQELGLSGVAGGDESGLSAGSQGYMECGLSGKTAGSATGLGVKTYGYQELGLAGKTGGTATGLLAPFKGYQELGLAGIVGTTDSGLSPETSGYQENGLAGKNGASETGLAKQTYGYQELGLAGKAGGTDTGLSAGTEYYVKVNLDGAGAVEKHFTTGADVTFTAVLALINAAMTLTLAGVVWSIEGGDVRVTSPTPGTGSSIAITAGTGGNDLLAALTDFAACDAAVPGVTSTYWFKVNTDGAGLNEYSIDVGLDSTYAAVMALMNAEMVGDDAGTTFTLSGTGDLRCSSASVGSSSSIALDAGASGTDLFASLTGWAAFDLAVAGTTPEYFFKINPDGTGVEERSIVISGSATQWTDILALMNAQMDVDLAGVVWSIEGGDIRCTSATTDYPSSIVLDAGAGGTDLFASLTGFAAFDTAVDGEGTYYFKVTPDGGAQVEKSITIVSGTTWTDVLALMNAQMTGPLAGFTWSIEGGDIRLTSPTLGTPSAVALAAGTTGLDLFANLSGFAALDVAVDGVSPVYYFKVNVDGGGATEKSIAMVSDATFGGVITLLNAQMTGGLAGVTFSLVGGDLRCTSPTHGTSSTMALTAGTSGTDLFVSITGAALEAAVNGAVAKYYIKVALDGAAASERDFDVDGDSTWAGVLGVLNPAMDGGLTGVVWSIESGDIRCTSPTDGGTSAIVISPGTGGSDMLSFVTGFTALETPVSGQPRYYFKITPNEGAQVETYIDIDDAVTYTDVIALLNAAMTGTLSGMVWSIQGGDLRCTAPIVPKNSVVLASGTTGTDLFTSLTGFTDFDDPVARVVAGEDPNDYSNIPSSGETRPYPINGAKDVAVFVWGDTNVTGDVTAYVGPTPTGPWGAVAAATSNPTTAGATIVVPAGYLAADFIKVGVGVYTGGPLRASVSAVRPNGNHIW